jgi:hypothetical protein
MQYLALVIILVVAAWAAYRNLPRYLARRRRGLFLPAGGPSVSRLPAPAVPVPTPGVESVVVETVARAFPVQGLPRSRDTAVALEKMLRRVAGVTAAYVSPLTALAYLDYHPMQVTEEQIAQAILSAGYQVGDASRRFDWRHVHGSS